jgi:hypothetical protein
LQLWSRIRALFLPGLLLLLPSAQPEAVTWRIHADGTGDAPTIQAAIDRASNGDTVRVGPGDYLGDIWIEGKGIVLCSEQGPAATTLRGTHFRDLPVIEVFYDGGNESTIEGFTIREGVTGIRLTSASPTIRSNVIMRNVSALGAGVCCNFGSNAVIEGNLIIRNRTWFQCCFPSRGGGIYADDTSAAVIRNNIIAYNTCDGACMGGGVSVFIATVEGNTIFGNRADGPAGGIELAGDGAVVANNIVYGNRSGEFGDGIAAFRGVDLRCNDVFGNGEEDYWGADPGPGDFSADPRFCGAPAMGNLPDTDPWNDFDLRADSPCLAGRHPQGADCGRIGARDAGCGSVPVSARIPMDGLGATVMTFPNPTGSDAEIRFTPSAPAAGDAVEILSAGGRLIARLGPSSPGSARWDGRDDLGRLVPAGLYFVRVLSGPDPQSGTVLVIR